MRKEIMAMAAAAAFALVGYLAWQSTREEPVVQSSAPAATPSQPTAPENTAAPAANQTAPAQPAQPSQ